MRQLCISLLTLLMLTAPSLGTPADGDDSAVIVRLRTSLTGKLTPASAQTVLDEAVIAERRARTPQTRAELGLLKWQALQAVLDTAPPTKAPPTAILTRYKRDIVYSEPSGRWLVVAQRMWELRDRYARTPVAEHIAWSAARQPIPGECEGDVTCYLFLQRMTMGHYLSLYPNGPHARAALSEMSTLLGYITNDKQGVYMWPTDAENRRLFKESITVLQKAVTSSTQPEKTTVLEKLKAVGLKGR